jgi:hypothetical protein
MTRLFCSKLQYKIDVSSSNIVQEATSADRTHTKKDMTEHDATLGADDGDSAP